MTQAAYIGLGSNLGDRQAHLQAAIAAMDAHPSVRVIKVSSFYETLPLGQMRQPMYLNAVAAVDTALSATELLSAMQDVERRLGRVRDGHWRPRTIDLDVLLFGDQIIQTPGLTIPHPQMHLRSFVLRGLCELDSRAMHPVLRLTAAQMYARLNGQDFALDASRPQLISVAGLIGVGKTTLALRLAECLGGKFIAEKYDDNPYLADVYAGHKEMALDSELFFLSSSATQLRKDRLKSGVCYVSDYVFDKALIYASSWLDADDLAAYKRHYACVAEQVTEPVLAIYLSDSVPACLERIHRRNRPYEQQIEPAFLAGQEQKYETLYADWTSCPLIRLTAAECVEIAQVKTFAEQVRHYLAV